MKNIYVPVLSFLLIVSFSFQACMTAPKYAQKRMDTTLVPSDFDPEKHILLLEEMPRKNKPDERNNSVTKKLDDAFKKYYSYRYEIVSLKEINEKSGKYSDTTVYKFALLNSLSTATRTSSIPETRKTSTGTYTRHLPTTTTTVIDFHFYDRISGKDYPETGNPHSNLSAFARAYAELIALAQKENTK